MIPDRSLADWSLRLSHCTTGNVASRVVLAWSKPPTKAILNTSDHSDHVLVIITTEIAVIENINTSYHGRIQSQDNGNCAIGMYSPLRARLALCHPPRRQRLQSCIAKLWAVVKSHSRKTRVSDDGPSVFTMKVKVMGDLAHGWFSTGLSSGSQVL